MTNMKFYIVRWYSTNERKEHRRKFTDLAEAFAYFKSVTQNWHINVYTKALNLNGDIKNELRSSVYDQRVFLEEFDND